MPPFHCPLCGGEEAGLLWPATRSERARKEFRPTDIGEDKPEVHRCAGCGLRLQWPLPSEEEARAPYLTYEDDAYLATEASRKATWRAALADTIGPGEWRALLDIGCYAGFFLDVAAEAGWRTCGVEPNRWAREIARKRHEIHDSLAGVPVPPGGFGAVTMWDVVEHLADPIGVLRAARNLLAPGGLLVLSTPDAGSLLARLCGRRWYCVRQEHLFYFNAVTMAKALAAAGLRPRPIQRFVRRFEAAYWLDRATRWAGLRSSPYAAPRAGWGRAAFPLDLGDQMLAIGDGD